MPLVNSFIDFSNEALANARDLGELKRAVRKAIILLNKVSNSESYATMAKEILQEVMKEQRKREKS